MRDDKQQQLKIELLSQWKLEAESRNLKKFGLIADTTSKACSWQKTAKLGKPLRLLCIWAHWARAQVANMEIFSIFGQKLGRATCNWEHNGC